MNSPHHGVGVIVRNRASTRFYIQQKDAQYEAYPLAYSLFGGAGEPGETPAEALARELDEELGDAAAALLAAGPTLVGEYEPGYRFSLFEIVVDDALLDQLALTPVLEGERGAVVDRDELAALPFVWGLEVVVRSYIGRS